MSSNSTKLIKLKGRPLKRPSFLLSQKMLAVLFTAFLVFVLGSVRDVLGYKSGYNTNPPTTAGPFPYAGVAAIYWKNLNPGTYNVFITVKHNGITYPEMDTSTFVPVGSSGLKFGSTGIAVAAGDSIEMRVRDDSQPARPPGTPPWWSRGWAPPGTRGPGLPQSLDLCGWDPLGKKNIAAERNYVAATGENLVSQQCWSDWDPNILTEDFDGNDAFLIVSYDHNDNPVGFHDGDSGSSAQCQVVGWACDQDKYTQPLNIHIYEGSTFLASTLANIPAEAGVAAACGGNADHRFSYTFPPASPIWDGSPHTISAYAINIDGAGIVRGSNPLLSNSPRTMTCVSPLGSDPWVQTKFGDVHANNSVNFSASPPSGEDNASYIISARGSIVGSSETNWIAQYYPEGDFDLSQNTTVSAPSYDTLWKRFGGGATLYSGPTLPSGNGTYVISGNKTVNAVFDQPANRSTLIFVNGDLTVNAEIRVPASSAIAFIVNGNINFAKNLTGGSGTTDSIGGLYVADETINTANNASSGEITRQLSVSGSLISLSNTVILNRNLSPVDNATTPAEKISLDGKYYVRLKSILGRPKFFYHEVPAGF
jgi:hypothetical protein